MNSKHLIAIVALLVGFAIFLILSKPLWWKDPAPSVDTALVERMQERLRALERGQEETRQSLDEVARALRGIERSKHSSTPDGAGTSAGDVPAAATERGDGTPGQPGTKPSTARLTVESAMALLTDPAQLWDAREEVWKRVRAAGLLDDVIKEFQKRAAANPKDPQLQTELGEAYLKKTEELGASQEAGQYATKADLAFDKALELDPEHWEARFVKAMALSFWPSVFGKQTEAIKHFETLVGQQERQSPRDGFDDTYLMLGNMYQQMGKLDQAVASWKRGLKLFPDNSALAQQIANAGQLSK